MVAVPDTWTDVDTTPVVTETQEQRPYIAAAPDLASFLTSFDTPGVTYTSLPFAPDPLDVVSQYGLPSGCETLEVKTYDDPVFAGVVQVGTDCGPQHMTWNMVVAAPADHAFTALVQVQTLPDDEARDVVLRTFNIAP